MLRRIDRFLIDQQHRKYNRPFKKFATSKAVYAITTILVVDRTIDEIKETYAEAHYAAMVMLGIAAALMIFYALRHIFLKKKVDKFEYRMKVFEAMMLLYTGYHKWDHLRHVENSPAPRIAILTLFLFASYLLLARLFYLKHIGKIAH